MYITCGNDIIEISRIKKAIERTESFKTKIFTSKEIEYCESRGVSKYEHYAVRFAAKEAIYKALNIELNWHDVEIINNKNGKPEIKFLKKITANFESIDISLSHCKEYATANAVVLYNKENKIKAREGEL